MEAHNFKNEQEAKDILKSMGIIYLNKEQVYFLKRLEIEGPLSFEFFSRMFTSDSEAEKHLKELEESDFIDFRGNTAVIKDKGLSLLENLKI